MKKALEVAEKCLIELSTNKVSHGQGICYLLEEALLASGASSAECYFIEFSLKGIMRSWDRFSGSLTYPVPSTKAGMSASDAYSTYQLWGRSRYGDYRRELAKYAAERMASHSEYFSSNSFWRSFSNDLERLLATPISELGDSGICSHAEGVRARATVMVSALCYYERFLRSIDFPVRHLFTGDPAEAFANGALWEGEYGYCRRVLLTRILEAAKEGCELTALID
jgi:hypothetical protein